MVEIYDEDTLTEFELNRQRNIIKNFEFMKACGLPVKPLIYVKRVHVPLEEQFRYLSDESSDSSDEEWTLGPKKKKKEKNEPKSAGWNNSSQGSSIEKTSQDAADEKFWKSKKSFKKGA